MEYKYCENRNFEDLSSGRVILHRTGYPNFPVRLAQEIFCRCRRCLDDPGSVCLYDPCCGGGYLLTVLGFLNYEKIGRIWASDVSEEAVGLALENLSLLHKDGLERRIGQLNQLLREHGRSSHREALDSAARLMGILDSANREIECGAFQADILSHDPFGGRGFKADLVFTDVPYGNLVEWRSQGGEDVNLLDQLLPVLKDQGVAAICSDKSQRFQSEHFQRVEKQSVGKRLFQIFKRRI